MDNFNFETLADYEKNKEALPANFLTWSFVDVTVKIPDSYNSDYYCGRVEKTPYFYKHISMSIKINESF